MNRAIDTLFYQWATTDDDKRIPTIIEDISEMEDAEKIDVLLTEYAGYVAELIEMEVLSRAIIDEKIQMAQEDPELAEEDQELVAKAIMESDDVCEIQEAVDSSKKALELLHNSMVRVFSREV
jgi:hypothetical protein